MKAGIVLAIVVLGLGGAAHARERIRMELPVDWELCAPCIPGGSVRIQGSRVVRIDYSISPGCVRVSGTYRTADAVAIFPDGRHGKVTGTETIRYDYCKSHKFLIHAYFNITDADGNRYTYREVRSGDEGDPVQIGGACEAFACR